MMRWRGHYSEEGNIILLSLHVEFGVLEAGHFALQELVLVAGEIDASHPHQEVLLLDAAMEQTKKQRIAVSQQPFCLRLSSFVSLVQAMSRRHGPFPRQQGGPASVEVAPSRLLLQGDLFRHKQYPSTKILYEPDNKECNLYSTCQGH